MHPTGTDDPLQQKEDNMSSIHREDSNEAETSALVRATMYHREAWMSLSGGSNTINHPPVE
jgi:hypothetical protein